MKNIIRKTLNIAWWLWMTVSVLIILFGSMGIVRGTSMAPTLSDGEIHLFSRYSEPEVGDIVMLRAYEGEKILVKRIVAGPGEEIEYRGEMMTLSDGEYFVLGDNREYSIDSRYFGAVQGDDILGVMVI